MNGSYLLPVYRTTGYRRISGYSGVASHGDYGEEGEQIYSEYGEFVTAMIIGGSILVGGGGSVAVGHHYGKKKGKKEGKKKQKAKSKKHYTAKMKAASAEYKKEKSAIQQKAAERQSALESTIVDRENERDRVAQNLRSQIQVTHFSDTKRQELGVTEQDLERLYAKERSQMLEEFAQTGATATQELEEIRLKEEGPDQAGISWKMILGAVVILGGGSYAYKNRKRLFKRKKK
jgi:hypothetical protein